MNGALLGFSMISCVSTKAPAKIADTYKQVSDTTKKADYEVKEYDGYGIFEATSKLGSIYIYGTDY